MKTRTVPALEARTRFSQILKEVEGGRVRVLVEKFGVPIVGVISARDFQRLIAERDARFEVIDRIRRRLPSVPNREIQGDLRTALTRVRRLRSR